MVYIVVPVYNRLRLTLSCLKALRTQNYREFKVILVDDGSTDGTAEEVASAFPEVKVLTGDGELWWAGATNLGIEYALSNSKNKNEDFVLMLNNDLTVDASYLDSLLAVYVTNKPCLVGSLSVNSDKPDLVDWAGVKWNTYTAKFQYLAKSLKLPYSQLLARHELLDTDLLTGRGMLVPLTAFEKVGLLDAEAFPQYAGDGDFSYRASRKGYKLVVAVRAKVASHVAETGLDFKYNKLSFRLFITSLSSIRSPTNVMVRYKWAMKNTKLRWVYFLFDMLRITASFHIRYYKSLRFN